MLRQLVAVLTVATIAAAPYQRVLPSSETLSGEAYDAPRALIGRSQSNESARDAASVFPINHGRGTVTVDLADGSAPIELVVRRAGLQPSIRGAAHTTSGIVVIVAAGSRINTAVDGVCTPDEIARSARGLVVCAGGNTPRTLNLSGHATTDDLQRQLDEVVVALFVGTLVAAPLIALALVTIVHNIVASTHLKN